MCSPPTDQADIFSESLPFPVQFALNVYLTKRISSVDASLLSGLERAGFKIYKGVDDSGIARLYFTRGGGYYIDVGCSQLIIDGKIKVKHCPGGIARFTPRGIVLNDEEHTELPADIVVLATGYDNMRTTVRKVLGDKVADRCKDVWDLDEEGELNAVCCPAQSKDYSRIKKIPWLTVIDMATLWPSSLLVHGRKPRPLSHLLQVPGAADQGHRGGVGAGRFCCCCAIEIIDLRLYIPDV